MILITTVTSLRLMMTTPIILIVVVWLLTIWPLCYFAVVCGACSNSIDADGSVDLGRPEKGFAHSCRRSPGAFLCSRLWPPSPLGCQTFSNTKYSVFIGVLFGFTPIF